MNSPFMYSVWYSQVARRQSFSHEHWLPARYSEQINSLRVRNSTDTITWQTPKTPTNTLTARPCARKLHFILENREKQSQPHDSTYCSVDLICQIMYTLRLYNTLITFPNSITMIAWRILHWPVKNFNQSDPSVSKVLVASIRLNSIQS